MEKKEYVISEKNAVIMKNSTWTPNEDFKDNTNFKDLIWTELQSIQISDSKTIHKLTDLSWTFDNLPFGTTWTIKIVFTPNS